MSRFRPIGPNVKRLIADRVESGKIPNKDSDDVLLLTPLQWLVRITELSHYWAFEAIDVVKKAPDNPFGDDDEAIAGEILRRLDEAKKKQ